MSRVQYDDSGDQWAAIRWAGAEAQAMRGKRGQAFLRELLAALDALPEKRLAEGTMQNAAGEVCALGAVCKARGIEPPTWTLPDWEDGVDMAAAERVAKVMGIARTLAIVIAELNDGQQSLWYWPAPETPERRFMRVRAWVTSHIRSPK